MIGQHNALNACAAILAASNLSIPLKFIKDALGKFEGVARRFTRIGFFNGATIIDDYAVPPAEIKAVISAAKEIATRRIIVVHQPHRFSRLNHYSPILANASEMQTLVLHLFLLLANLRLVVLIVKL